MKLHVNACASSIADRANVLGHADHKEAGAAGQLPAGRRVPARSQSAQAGQAHHTGSAAAAILFGHVLSCSRNFAVNTQAAAVGACRSCSLALVCYNSVQLRIHSQVPVALLNSFVAPTCVDVTTQLSTTFLGAGKPESTISHRDDDACGYR